MSVMARSIGSRAIQPSSVSDYRVTHACNRYVTHPGNSPSRKSLTEKALSRRPLAESTSTTHPFDGRAAHETRPGGVHKEVVGGLDESAAGGDRLGSRNGFPFRRA